MRIKEILLAILLAVSSLTSFATDYYLTTTTVNVRSGEGTEYPVLFTLQKGDEVAVLARNNSWCRIKYSEKTGYVSSKYLKYNKTISVKRSDASQPNVLNLPIGICLSLTLFILFDIARKTKNRRLVQTVTELNRGERSERELVLKLLKYGIPAHVLFHDLYVEKYKGNFSQIDLVAVTEVGILVFEVKDYSGWIFGSGNQFQWTKVLGYDKYKYHFYNPIMQNNRHVAELKKQLIQFGNIPFYSIVVFYGNCKLKKIDFVPSGTYVVKPERVLDVVKFILKQNAPAHYAKDVDIFRVLKQAVINGGISENRIRHKKNIEDMLR